MNLTQYARALLNTLAIGHEWERSQAIHFAPSHPHTLYALMEKAGFSPDVYRNHAQDLIDGLPSDDFSAMHFVQFMDSEVRSPRYFPIHLNPNGLHAIADAFTFRNKYKASLIRHLIQAQIDFNPSCVEHEEFWFSILGVIKRIGNPIVFIGDSHTRVFRQTVTDRGSIIIPLNLLCGGGSAIGLPNMTSRSGYGARIKAAMGAITSAAERTLMRVPVCLKFGQVDIEFVHTFRRAQRMEETPSTQKFEDFCDQVITAYVIWVAQFKLRDIHILGVNPPCIKDAYVHEAYNIQARTYVNGGVADAANGTQLDDILAGFDTLKFPNQRERTKNSKLFNTKLKSECNEHAINYVCNFDDFIGTDGCIEPKYACASDGTTIQIGGDGKDIHIGGTFALAKEAQLVRTIIHSLN